MLVPNGSVVTYRGHWPSDLFYWSAASYVGEISAQLAARGLVTRNSNWNGSFLGLIPAGGMDVELTLQVENGLGFGSQDDIISLVRHEVYNAVGEYPNSDSIPLIQVPGGTSTPTGQPAPASTTQSTDTTYCNGSDDSTGSWSLTCWLRSLTTQGMWLIGLLAIGALAASYLISTGHVRR